jgi:hypothetical protein
MSRFRRMPAFGWLVVGIAVAVLALPTVAGAKDLLKFTGIEGTSGNEADVTPAGQLLTTAAQPSNLLGGTSSDAGIFTATSVTNGGHTEPVFTAPSSQAVIMDSLSLDVIAWAGSPGPDMAYDLYVGNSSCALAAGHWVMTVNPTGYGTTEVPLTPGVAVPAGGALCALAYTPNSSDSLEVVATATGFLAPSSSVSEAPSHALPALKPAANG